jgi:hypothetical protein
MTPSLIVKFYSKRRVHRIKQKGKAFIDELYSIFNTEYKTMMNYKFETFIIRTYKNIEKISIEKQLLPSVIEYKTRYREYIYSRYGMYVYRQFFRDVAFYIMKFIV